MKEDKIIAEEIRIKIKELNNLVKEAESCGILVKISNNRGEHCASFNEEPLGVEISKVEFI